jgi:hypothetical protein
MLDRRGFFPAPIDTAIPVEAAAEAVPLESAHEYLEALRSQESPMRPIGQAIIRIPLVFTKECLNSLISRSFLYGVNAWRYGVSLWQQP